MHERKMKRCLVIIWVVLETTFSTPIVFNAASPWQHGHGYMSTGFCTFTLDRIYPASEWTINVTTNLPTTSLTNWVFVQTGSNANTYYLESLHSEGPGDRSVSLQFEHQDEVTLTGYCDSNVNLEDISTNVVNSLASNFVGLHPVVSVTENVNSYTTNSIIASSDGDGTISEEDLTSSRHIELTSDTVLVSNTEHATWNEYEICTCRAASRNITNEELLKKIADLERKLKVNRKDTVMAKSKKVSFEDNRPSSKAIGGIGILLMCCFFGVIIISDMDELLRSIDNVYSFVKFLIRKLN